MASRVGVFLDLLIIVKGIGREEGNAARSCMVGLVSHAMGLALVAFGGSIAAAGWHVSLDNIALGSS